MINFLAKATRYLKKKETQLYLSRRKKIFCIGRNKTGTTSIKKAFKELGYIVGNQRKAELLSTDYFNGNFQSVIEYCKTAEVFQDVPFSWPDTYKHLDKTFPSSKFILTVRDNSEQWYQSFINFQTKIFGTGDLPSWEMLKNQKYVYEGWAYNNRINLYGLTENDNPYDKEILINHYEAYNREVINYFSNRKDDLLILNLSEKDAYRKFCDFIGVKSAKLDFPWENKTTDINI